MPHALRRTAYIIALAMPAVAQAAPAITILYNFGPPPGTPGIDGFPSSGLATDQHGNLYGTIQQGGTFGDGFVYMLRPPAAGQTAWTESVLYNFTGGADGGFPAAAVTPDDAGGIYGTTARGGYGFGTVFKLSPPPTGQTNWLQATLYKFQGLDGNGPHAPVLLAGGSIYGTTINGGENSDGTVFRLDPPVSGGQWTNTVLYTFTGVDGEDPSGPLVMNAAGTIYGTTPHGGTDNDGIVYALQAPASGGTSWTESILHSFTGQLRNGTGADGSEPGSGLTYGPDGLLYGTTSIGGVANNGTIFNLTPPPAGQTAWTETKLHDFAASVDGTGPSGLAFSNTGTAFGTADNGGTQRSGTLFRLTPTSVPAGWTVTVLYDFNSTDGTPNGVIIGTRPALFGTAQFGGSTGQGTAFEFTR